MRVLGLLLITALPFPLLAIESIASGGKVYMNAMNGFESYLAAAFRAKQVPLTVVANRAVADYEIVGNSESQKAGFTKFIFLKQNGSREAVTISVIDLRTSEVVFAYNYYSGDSYRGKQSASESCAKHLAAHIRIGGRLASILPRLTLEQIADAKQRDAAELGEARRNGDSDRMYQMGLHPYAARVVENMLPATALTQLGAKPPNPQAILVRFISTPAGAEVQIDGEYWGTTPTADLTRIGTGSHSVVVKKYGYQRWERKIRLALGDARTIQAELEREPEQSGKPKIVGLD